MGSAGKHVAVLMGGWSSEREISLRSGTQCADALESRGFRVTRVDAARDVASVLADLRPDVAFNALHGPFGEDGCIQGVLEVLGIPYTHSGVLASALAMDKARAKAVMEAAGVPVAPHAVVDRHEAAARHVLPPPYVIKPIAEGSSFGIVIVREGRDPAQEVGRADWPYGDAVMVERYVAGRELTCAVMGDEALGVLEIQPAQGAAFYDFDAKYRPGGSIHVLPAPLSSIVYQNIRILSLKAHQALGCRGVSRADFRLDDRPGGTGELVCLEVNTQPGMTATSLVPEIAAHAGRDLGDLVTWMVEDASCGR